MLLIKVNSMKLGRNRQYFRHHSKHHWNQFIFIIRTIYCALCTNTEHPFDIISRICGSAHGMCSRPWSWDKSWSSAISRSIIRSPMFTKNQQKVSWFVRRYLMWYSIECWNTSTVGVNEIQALFACKRQLRLVNSPQCNLIRWILIISMH